MSLSRVSVRRLALRRNVYVRPYRTPGKFRGAHNYERPYGPKRLKPDIHETDAMEKQRNWWHSYMEETVVRVEPPWRSGKIDVNKLTDARFEAIAHELSKIVRGRVTTSMLDKSQHESLFLRKVRKSGDANEGP